MMNTGFAELKLIKSFHESHPLAKYLADGLVLESYLVGDTFKDLFTEVVYNPDTWKENIFYFDGMLNCPMDKPSLNMDIEWCGPEMKSIFISIDVVPAVRFSRWLPKEMENRNPDLAPQGEFIKNECFLLFQSPVERVKQNRKYLRISQFSSELKYLKSLPGVYLESYAAAKIIITANSVPGFYFLNNLTSVKYLMIHLTNQAGQTKTRLINQKTVGLTLWR